MIACGMCACASVLSRWFRSDFTKRKLGLYMTVGFGRAGMFCNYGTCAALINSPIFQAFMKRQENNLYRNTCVEDLDLISCFWKETYIETSDSYVDRNVTSGLNVNKSCLLDAFGLDKTRGLASPNLLLQQQNVRHFSRRRRHIDKGSHDDDDEEKKQRLRGAVMYVSNPLTWISKQWNMLKLRHKLDPSFSENEFLFGAKQAISHVSQMVSTGKFDQLSGLVIEEVIDWLMSFRNSLASTEREALALGVDDVVLMKIRYVHLDSDQDKALAFVDSVCFGLRLCDSVPYFVDLGIRFKRDYSTDPPGDWVVAGVSHIRLQNLATN